MGTLSTFAANEFVDHILKTGSYTPGATIYLALSTTTTNAAGNVTEPSGNGYVRKTISFGAASSRARTQDAIVTFDQASGSWGTITDYALYDAESGGNFLAFGVLSSSKAVVSGNTPSVASTEVAVSFDAGKISTYLADASLDWLFDGGTLTQPTNVYCCLIETTEITDTTTGSTIDELDMTGYEREINDTWDVSSSGASANTGIIDFGTLTSTAETVTATCLVDAATNGNVLFYDNTPNQLIGDGDSVTFPAGDFDVSVS